MPGPSVNRMVGTARLPVYRGTRRRQPQATAVTLA